MASAKVGSPLEPPNDFSTVSSTVALKKAIETVTESVAY
jgi:hypothetical protein